MTDLNKVMLIGRVGKEPDCRNTSSGIAITSISVSTTRKWRTNGERKEATEWHRVVTFERLAEVCMNHLKTGSLIYVEGRLHTRKWTEKDGSERGSERYVTEVVAESVQFLANTKTRPDSDEDATD